MQVVAVTDHAVARYRERVKPALSFRAAERELLALLPFAVFATEAPSWVPTGSGADVVGWAVLTDGVAFPLARQDGDEVEVAATTCLTRGGRSEDEVERRRGVKAARRHDKRHNHDNRRATRRRRWDAA